MAKQQSPVDRSKIMADIKNRGKGTFQRVKKTEAKAGGSGLPPGIRDGIAKVSSWKLDKTKLKKNEQTRKVTGGDPFFTITAICVEPKEFDGVKCEGKRATFMYFLNETEYSTFEENYEKFCNDLQLMGIDTTKMKSDDEIPTALDKLCKGENYIFFNTSARRNKPGEVNYYVQGKCESFSGEDSGDSEPEGEAEETTGNWNEGDPCQVEYEGEMYTATVVSDDGSGTVTIAFDSDGSEMEYSIDEVLPPDEQQEAESEGEPDEVVWSEGDPCQVDYEGEMWDGTIVSIADDTATVEFEDGSQFEYTLGDLGPPADSDGEPAPDEAANEEPDWQPAKDDIYSYTPKGKKAGEYIVTAVNADKQTVSLKNTKNAKDIHQNVSWDSLATAE